MMTMGCPPGHLKRPGEQAVGEQFGRCAVAQSRTRQAVTDAIALQTDGERRTEELGHRLIGKILLLRTEHDSDIGFSPDRRPMTRREPERGRRRDPQASEAISALQAAPGVPAERGAQVGGPAAHDLGHVDTAREGEVSPAAGPRCLEGEQLACVQSEARPHPGRAAGDSRGKVCASDSEHERTRRAQARARERKLQARRSRRIPNQEVGHLERQRIHGACPRKAELAVPNTAKILNRGEETPFLHDHRRPWRRGRH
jgi:hypothetical protein